MKISSEGLALIKKFEGCRLKAYRCPAGKWTIGYGSTGDHVKEGMTITQDEADALLLRDLERFERYVNSGCRVVPTQSQFDALVSFCFNVGPGSEKLGRPGFLTSTALCCHNQGDFEGAAEGLLLWVKAGRQTLPGLVSRRLAEYHLYLKEDSDVNR